MPASRRQPQTRRRAPPPVRGGGEDRVSNVVPGSHHAIVTHVYVRPGGKAMIRKLAVEFLGTAILVFVAVGVATLMFGFKFAGTSVAAGVVATALAFGLTLLALV